MSVARLRVDRGVCDGAGFCEMIAATHFRRDEQGLVSLRREQVDDADLGEVEEAVDVCPTGAISLERVTPG